MMATLAITRSSSRVARGASGTVRSAEPGSSCGTCTG